MYNNEGESELTRGRQWDYSDNWAAVHKLEGTIFCKEVIRQVPPRVVFGRLNDEEKLLARLIYFEEMSPLEIAHFLGQDKDQTDKKRLARACNRIRNKIRKRIQSVIKGTALENVLFKEAGPAEKVTVKKPRAALNEPSSKASLRTPGRKKLWPRNEKQDAPLNRDASDF